MKKMFFNKRKISFFTIFQICTQLLSISQKMFKIFHYLYILNIAKIVNSLHIFILICLIYKIEIVPMMLSLLCVIMFSFLLRNFISLFLFLFCFLFSFLWKNSLNFIFLFGDQRTLASSLWTFYQQLLTLFNLKKSFVFISNYFPFCYFFLFIVVICLY